MKVILVWVFAMSLIDTTDYESVVSKDVTLNFTIHQEQSVYEQSIYGEPPQFAIWLEQVDTGKIRSVIVTKKTATGDFIGKAKVPVALPAWIGAFREEYERNDFPTPDNPVNNYDSISRPTPKVTEISTQVNVPKDSNWRYFVEVNVAGDYTPEFPALHDNGAPDRHGNGQPSIIYRGEITASVGNQSTPELIGRTEQMYFTTDINPDLTGIKNANEVFSSIKVICKE